MAPFEYLSVVWSIVLGLALTHLLTAARGLIVERAGLAWSWPPVLWAAVLVVMLVQNWWAGFDFNSRQAWTFDDFAAILGMSIALYMTSALILPDARPGASTDLESHFVKVRPWFFGCLGTAVVMSAVKEVATDGRLPEGSNLIFHALFLSAAMAGGLVARPGFQRLLPVAFGLILATYIGLLFVGL